MTTQAEPAQYAALFAAARDLLAARDGDGRTRAERFLADPRRGCACSAAAEPCRACRTVIALATDVVGTREPVRRKAPAGRPVVVWTRPQTDPTAWARQVIREHRTRHGVAS